MNDHVELLKDARDAAGELDNAVNHLPNTLADCIKAPHIMRTLADIVEQQDKQSDINAELLATCRTCDEAIEWVLGVNDSPWPFNDKDWTKLRAAGYLVKRAVEMTDKQRVVEATPDYDTLMEWSPKQSKAKGGA